MLCPVCNETPLTGRKATAKTCSTKCRSALSRQRKKQQRDTPHEEVGRKAGTGIAATQRQHRSRSSDTARWEQLLAVATERIVEAVQKHGRSAAPRSMATMRVDMREQVTAQAPKLAAGYRLVLPARHPGDAPKWSPRRGRASHAAWYSLSPFEYPDDIRLYDGCWYRIVWVDAAGQRIRLQPGEPVPGLYYFVGPTRLGDQTSTSSPAAACAIPPQAAPEIPPKPAITDRPAVGPEQATPSTKAETAAAPAPISAIAPSAPPATSHESEIDARVSEFARASETDQEQARRLGISDDTELPPGSMVLMLPPAPTSTPPESWTRLLASFPPPTSDESMMLIIFVTRPELILQIRYEEQLAEAKARGRDLPREPITLISPETRHKLHELFRERQLPPHFWSRCKAIFQYARQHGVEVLDHLPVPVAPLPADPQRLIDSAITSRPKQMYMHYICALQDALLDGQPLPVEPSVPLSSKERNQMRKVLGDLRAVIYFKGRVAATAS